MHLLLAMETASLAAWRQTDAAPAANPLLAFLPFILIFAVFYFLIIRPQNKRQKEHKALVKAIQKGDRVVTAGGIHGIVRGVNEEKDIVVLEISDRVKVEISRASIARVLKEE